MTATYLPPIRSAIVAAPSRFAASRGTGSALAIAVLLALLPAAAVRAQTPPAGTSPAPSFEVASIKPNRSGDMSMSIMFQPGRFVATGMAVKQLITMAYDIKDFQVTGGPGWIDADRFDIDAKEPEGFAEGLDKLPRDQRRAKLGQLIQSLLADRFALKVSHATKELPVYALVVAKSGPKIQAAKPGDTYPNGIKGPDGRALGHGGMMRMGPGQLTGQGLPIASLVGLLSQQLGRDVLDQTNLKGNYDFDLRWTPDQVPAGMPMGPEGPKPVEGPPPDTSGPSIFTAIQEQLGLKLESTKGPVEILVIDHIERPSEN
jgi:uncharacterized protein (TIGR03435 family)